MKIESGWQGFQEVNRVVFDADQVTIEEMVGYLKMAGTYIETLELTLPPDSGINKAGPK